MDTNHLQREAFASVRHNVSKDGRVNLVLELAEQLGVSGEVVPIERAETMAREIAEDLNRTKEVRDGDTVITPHGEARAAVVDGSLTLSQLCVLFTNRGIGSSRPIAGKVEGS